MTIQQVRVELFVIKSEDNVLADLLSRWGYSDSTIKVFTKNEDFDETIEDAEKPFRIINSDELNIQIDELNSMSANYKLEPKSFVTNNLLTSTSLPLNPLSLVASVAKKDLISKFRQEFLNYFKDDLLSFYNPYYGGKFSLLTHADILDYQRDKFLQSHVVKRGNTDASNKENQQVIYYEKGKYRYCKYSRF